MVTARLIQEDELDDLLGLLTGSDQAWKHQFYERCGFDKDAKTEFELDLR